MSLTAPLMEGAPGGSSLPLPSGPSDEPLLLESSAPRPGRPCPSPAPSPVTDHSGDRPEGLRQPHSSSGSSVPGSPSVGSVELLRQPGAGGLGVPLTSTVACSALPLGEATVLPILVTGSPGGQASLLGEGGLPSWGRAARLGAQSPSSGGGPGKGTAAVPDLEAGVFLP